MQMHWQQRSRLWQMLRQRHKQQKMHWQQQ